MSELKSIVFRGMWITEHEYVLSYQHYSKETNFIEELKLAQTWIADEIMKEKEELPKELTWEKAIEIWDFAKE